MSLGCAPTTVWSVVKGLVANRNREDYEVARKRFRSLKTTDLHWIAGIIDGEGWIGIGRNKSFNGPRVTVASTDGVMAPELHCLLGGSLCVKKTPRKSNRRPTNAWDLFTLSTVRAFCEIVGPSLRVKRCQAKTLASYCASRMENRTKRYTEKEMALVSKLRRLNRRGRFSDD